MKRARNRFIINLRYICLIGVIALGLVSIVGSNGGGDGDGGGGEPVQYVLTVTTSGQGSVSLDPQGGTYDEGTVVTLTAQAGADWEFSGWSGDLTGSNTTATITMNSDKTVTATFIESSGPETVRYTLTVTTSGQGSVSLDPQGGTYDEGTVVTLTAQAGADWEFSGWSGDLTGSNTTATITMNSDKTVTATFIVSVPFLIRENDYSGPEYRSTTWLVASLRKESGEFVTGCDVSDFQLTESIILKADGSVKAQEEIDMAAFIAEESEDLGFWECSVGGTPIDIVFLLDKTDTMGDYFDDIRSEIQEFVSSAMENHVDFRVAAVTFGPNPNYISSIPFYGPQQVDLLYQEIDSIQIVTAGWPSVAYDALLFTPWLGFREEARKVCVVITDIVPQTVYGPGWQTNQTTAATRSAAELFLEGTGIELYYCQRDWDSPELTTWGTYVDDDINPLAGDGYSGFAALTGSDGSPLAVAISWPFDQDELQETLGIDTPQTVGDSRYLFSWESSFDRWEAVEDAALIYYPEEYELRVTIKVADPDHDGEFLTDTCSYPIDKEIVDITINVTGEEGDPFEELWADLSIKMGDRNIFLTKWQCPSEDGQISVINLPVGTYNVFIRNSGDYSYAYETVRAIHRETIDVTTDGQVFDMQVATADKVAELCKAGGLLKDIADWGLGATNITDCRLPGDPFQEFVDSAEAWLNYIESDGISWEDMVAIKRFYVGLSGYANIIAYSQREACGAIDDFNTIVQQFRDIVVQIEAIHDDTLEDWLLELASGLLTIIDVLITHGEFTIQKELLEEALDNLVTYIAEQLTQDLRAKIIEQFPIGDYSELLEKIVNYLIDAAFGGSTSEPDWEPVLEAVQAIAIDEAMDFVQEQALGILVDDLIQISILDDEITQAVKALIKDILEAFLSDSDQFDEAFEEFAQGIGAYITTYDEETIAATVNDVFEQVDAALEAEGAPIDVRDFLVGMARELTLLAIPNNDGGSVNYEIDTDTVVSVLIKYGVYYVILKDYFIDEITSGLEQTLIEAESYVVSDGTGFPEWAFEMQSDFFDYCGYVKDVQDDAWSALSEQDAITEWAKGIQNLCDALGAISEPLDLFANLWPDLQDTAENVHACIAILDGFQILANAISFGLKVDCLDTFGNQAEPMYQAVFPSE
jgi:hypothetical protein